MDLFLRIFFAVCMAASILFVALFIVFYVARGLFGEEWEKETKMENLRLVQELEATRCLVVRLADTDHDHKIEVFAGKRLVGGMEVRRGQVYFSEAPPMNDHELMRVQRLRTYTTPRQSRK